jgi:hypothetical protein
MKRMNIQDQKKKTRKMLLICNPRRRMLKPKEQELVLKFMVVGIKKETFSLKLFLRVKKSEIS